MLLREFIEALPQIGVLHGLLVGGLPATLLPVVYPLGNALLHILRIGMQLDQTAPVERLQRPDHRQHFHPVGGGQRLAAKELARVVAIFEPGTPAADPGVSLAGTVGIYVDYL